MRRERPIWCFVHYPQEGRLALVRMDEVTEGNPYEIVFAREDDALLSGVAWEPYINRRKPRLRTEGE